MRERKLLIEFQIKQLEANPDVLHVSEKNITFVPTFKLASVKAYQAGKTPMEIFSKAGFDVDMFDKVGRRELETLAEYLCDSWRSWSS